MLGVSPGAWVNVVIMTSKRIFYSKTAPQGSVVTDRDHRHCQMMINHAEALLRHKQANPSLGKALPDHRP